MGSPHLSCLPNTNRYQSRVRKTVHKLYISNYFLSKTIFCHVIFLDMLNVIHPHTDSPMTTTRKGIKTLLELPPDDLAKVS